MRITRTLLAAALAAALFPAFASDTPAPSAPREDAAARDELRAAREELRTLTRRIAELSARLGADAGRQAYAFRYLADTDRAMIGVVLGADADAVVLAGVTPGGPAEKAGLLAGDRIVAVNGKPVDSPEQRRTPGGLERALADDLRVEVARGLIGELKAGDNVRLAYVRNGKQAEATVAAERRESWDWPMWAGNIEIPEFEFELPHDFDKQIAVIVDDSKRAAAQAQRDVARAQVEVRRVHRDVVRDAQREVRRVSLLGGGGLWNLRLAPLNPELGKYFGTDQGVLVLENDGNALGELKAGDVIVAIAGRKTESTPDAMRVIAEQEPGAAVNVEVLRDRKRQVLVVTVPPRRSFEMLFPLPPLPPMAPMAPAPPQPPTAKAPPPPHPPSPVSRPAPPAPPSPPTPPARPPRPPTPPPSPIDEVMV